MNHFSPRIFFACALLIVAGMACGFGIQPDLEGGAGQRPSSPAPVVSLPTQVTAATQIPTAIPLPAIPEKRRLTLEYPAEIRLGDTDIIRLTLEVDDLGNITPTALYQGNVISGAVVEIPNLYETHKVTAEARLDMSGPIITPLEKVSEPLLPGQAVTFFWSVRPQDAGRYRGTVWLFLRFVDRSSGEESEKALSAQRVEIEATTFWGLEANTARVAGGVGSVIGSVLGFPFVDDIIKFLFGKLKKKK